VPCHARAATFDIPMNGSAAVVLFGSLGLAGLAVAGLVSRLAVD
jgi:hypothetical protein